MKSWIENDKPVSLFNFQFQDLNNKIKPDYVIAANNYLYVLDQNQSCAFKFDHNGSKNQNEPPPRVCTGIEDVTTMQVGENGDMIFGKPVENSCTISILNDSDFNQDARNVAFTFANASTANPPEMASNLSISRNLQYLAFSVKSQIYVYTAPFDVKSSPQIFDKKSKVVQQIQSNNETITNISITNDGVLFFTTNKGAYVLSIIPGKTGLFQSSDKLNPINISNQGVDPKYAFITENNYFYAIQSTKKVKNNEEKQLYCIYYFKPERKGNEFVMKQMAEIHELDSNQIFKQGPVGNYIWISYNENLSDSLIVLDLLYNPDAFKGNYGQTAEFVAYLWGSLLIVTANEVLKFNEIHPQEKLDRLLNAKRFENALSMAEEYNLGEEAIAKVHRIWGDYLFDQRKFDESIEHYIKTVRFTEPSHVIAKFVDPHHAQNLARYLQAIPPELKSKQHTTLLFNCFTKVKDEQKLGEIVDKFVGEANDQNQSFDVETAVDVLKRNGYQKYAEKLAQAYKMDNLYMSLLYEGQQYSRMLDHMENIPGSRILKILNEYGAEIIAKYPEGSEKFIDFVAKVCTQGVSNYPSDGITIIDPVKLAPIFVNNPQEHFDFLCRVRNSGVQLSEQCWNTLIELALRTKSDLIEELLEDPNAQYSHEQVLVYLHAFNYEKGLAHQYEEMKLYPFLLHQAQPEEIVEICTKYGPTMPELWSDGLIAIADSQCSEETLSQFLDALKEANVVPFLTVLTVLKTHGKHSFASAQNYVKAVFSEEQKRLKEAKEATKKNLESAAADDAITENITKHNMTINLQERKCTCGESFRNESVRHFFCGHTFHQRCTSTICSICKKEYEKVARAKLEKIKRAREDIPPPDDGYDKMLDDISNSLFFSGISLDSVENTDYEIAEIETYLKQF